MPIRSCRESGCRYLCFFCACFAMLAPLCASGAQAKRVLVVHSFGTVAPPFTNHSTAFETELVDKMGQRVDLDEVSLDMARYADPHLQDALVEYLQKRQAEWQPDLVVPIGSPAGIFVAQNRQRSVSRYFRFSTAEWIGGLCRQARSKRMPPLSEKISIFPASSTTFSRLRPRPRTSRS